MARVGIGGMPTDVDVERLRRQIGVPKPGETISYERISEILGLARDTNRWRSVVSAWNKRLRRENNIVLEAEDNVGYRALSNTERVGWVTKRVKGGRRRLVDAARVAVATERSGLDEEHCRALEHTQNVVSRWVLAEATAMRQVSPPDPQVKALTGTQG